MFFLFAKLNIFSEIASNRQTIFFLNPTKIMKKVAGKLRLELATYNELASFSQFASDLDASTRRKLDN